VWEEELKDQLFEIDHNRPFGFTAFREHMTEKELREQARAEEEEEEEEDDDDDDDDDENDRDYLEREGEGVRIEEEEGGAWWRARGEEDVEVGRKRRGRDWLLPREESDEVEGLMQGEVEREEKGGVSNGVLLAGFQGDEEEDVDVGEVSGRARKWEGRGHEDGREGGYGQIGAPVDGKRGLSAVQFEEEGKLDGEDVGGGGSESVSIMQEDNSV
jgi:hypothetical protein